MLTTLKPIPTGFNSRVPHSLYYYDDKNQKGYIIVTPYGKDSNKCYKFDTKEKEWINFTNYPKGFEPCCHALALNEEGLLYFTHGHGQPVFGTFNMITKKWTIMANDSATCQTHNIISISNGNVCVLPNGHLYLFEGTVGGRHLLYDCSSSTKWIDANTNGINNNKYLDTNQFINIKGKHMLMVLGGYGQGQNRKEIWFTHYNSTSLTERFVWKRFDIDLPKTSFALSCVVAFDMVVIILIDGEMFVLDIADDQHKWVKSNVNVEFPENTKSLIVSEENELYFINVYQGEAVNSKIHLSQCLPSNIYYQYKIKYVLTVYGYCKRYVTVDTFPDEMMQLIAKFYCNL